jgi:hypothetical protein
MLLLPLDQVDSVFESQPLLQEPVGFPLPGAGEREDEEGDEDD